MKTFYMLMSIVILIVSILSMIDGERTNSLIFLVLANQGMMFANLHDIKG
jgi:hypothetical protein